VASKDIVQNGVNGIVLENISAEGLEKAFLYYENLKEDSLIKGSKISKEIGSKYDSKAYYNALKRITNDLLY
jgi:hypothetical protein